MFMIDNSVAKNQVIFKYVLSCRVCKFQTVSDNTRFFVNIYIKTSTKFYRQNCSMLEIPVETVA